jgi:hypothetical protein
MRMATVTRPRRYRRGTWRSWSPVVRLAVLAIGLGAATWGTALAGPASVAAAPRPAAPVEVRVAVGSALTARAGLAGHAATTATSPQVANPAAERDTVPAVVAAGLPDVADRTSARRPGAALAVPVAAARPAGLERAPPR